MTYIPCKLSKKYKPNKYGYYAIFPKAHNGHALLHRKVYAEYYTYTFKKGDVVRHACDNPSCIEPTHLMLGTQKDNVWDSVEAGTHKNPVMFGDKNPMWKGGSCDDKR